MGIILARTPPADNSGGYMSVRFKEAGRLINVARFHVPQLNSDTTYTAPTGSETSVTQTFNALFAKLADLYDDSWRIELTALTARVGGGLVRVGVPTNSDGTYLGGVGTGSTATTGVEGIVRSIFTFHVFLQNARARVSLMGIGGQGVDLDTNVPANTGGSPQQKLVAYLVGSATSLATHDGGRYGLPCHLTTVLAKKPRQRSLRVA